MEALAQTAGVWGLPQTPENKGRTCLLCWYG